MIPNLISIQIIGLVFGLAMLYMTYLAFRKREFRRGDALLWGIAWFSFVLTVIFPGVLDIFLDRLHIQGAIPFFTIFGFIFLASVIFSLYKTIKKTSRKMEKIVTELALRDK